MRDDTHLIRHLAGETRQAIERAAVDPSRWDAVTEIMASFIPDSFAAVFNQDVASSRLSIASVAGMEASAFQAFLDYYAALNPWEAEWARHPSGHILVTEREAPTRLYAETEFHRDWFRKLGGFEAAVGTRLGGAADSFYATIHYPLSLSGAVDTPLAAAMRGLQRHFVRALDINRRLGDRLAKAASAAALIDREDAIGFALDYSLRVVEMNETAERAFRRGAPVFAAGGMARLRNQEAARWMAAGVRSLLAGEQPAAVKRVVRDGARLWQVSLLPLPEPASAARRYVTFRRVVIVLIRDLNEAAAPIDHRSLSLAFRLTPAETRLCATLAEGLTLSEAAERLAVTRETARDRLKTVFQKTRTARQAELALLLSRFR